MTNPTERDLEEARKAFGNFGVHALIPDSVILAIATALAARDREAEGKFLPKLVLLHAAVEKARARFTEYAAHHLTKPDVEKAKRNSDMAAELLDALEPSDAIVCDFMERERREAEDRGLREAQKRERRDARRIAALSELVASLSAHLTDEGGGEYSADGLDSMRRRVASALPDCVCPDWLRRYRDAPVVQGAANG